jgi:hypothetical protein
VTRGLQPEVVTNPTAAIDLRIAEDLPQFVDPIENRFDPQLRLRPSPFAFPGVSRAFGSGERLPYIRREAIGAHFFQWFSRQSAHRRSRLSESSASSSFS